MQVDAGLPGFVFPQGQPVMVNAFEGPGAIPLSELKARLSTLSKDQEIVFYCA
jgi:rhodanese-related sulfurtransferase